MLAELSPEFRAWAVGSGSGAKSAPADASSSQEMGPAASISPDEAITQQFRRYRSAVEAELLELLRQVPPARFERIVIDLLLRLGYGGTGGQGVQVGGPGDGGIDGVIYEDKLGLDLIYIQAKRWNGSVGAQVVYQFLGSLSTHKASKGVLITTGHFTADAEKAAQAAGTRVVLIGGEQLAALMYDTGLGLATAVTYELKRLDSDYFEEL